MRLEAKFWRTWSDILWSFAFLLKPSNYTEGKRRRDWQQRAQRLVQSRRCPIKPWLHRTWGEVPDVHETDKKVEHTQKCQVCPCLTEATFLAWLLFPICSLQIFVASQNSSEGRMWNKCSKECPYYRDPSSVLDTQMKCLGDINSAQRWHAGHLSSWKEKVTSS